MLKIYIKQIFFKILFLAWLNNCVGFGNHRYFFLYMVYTILGCFFLAAFGFRIFIEGVFLEQEHWTEVEPLVGQPVKFNLSGHIIPVVSHLKL